MFKFKILYVFLLSFSTYVQGQSESFFSVQSGFLGIWINNESELNDFLFLKTEIGLDAGLYPGDKIGNVSFMFVPSFSVQPKYYYNLEKRESKGKNTLYNSANFVGLKLQYNPNWFVISNSKNIGKGYNNVSVIPKWGIRRTFFEKLSLEAGLGVGYRHYFIKNFSSGEVAIDLLLRVGYVF